MDKVLPEPVSPPVELLLLFLRCPRRGERGSRGERPGLPDTDPLPLDPTTSSLETERELPYMMREYGVYTVEIKECLDQIDVSGAKVQKVRGDTTVQRVSWCPGRYTHEQTDSPRVNVVGGLCAHNIKLHKEISRSNKLKIDVQKKNLKCKE